MAKDKTNDMTVGNPVSLIIRFMIPMCLGNIFQQFYNIADSIVAGQFLGVDALAAIGSTGSLMFFVTGWLNGLSSGFAILVSQWFGAKQYDKMRHYVAMSIYLAAAFAIVMTIGFEALNEPILRLMNSPEDLMGSVKGYMGIIYAGLIVTAAYNSLAAFLRALGDSKSPLYFLIISAVINVFLDILFIVKIGMGVEGCAYATVIAQAISAVCCLIYIIKKFPILHLKKENFEVSFTSFRYLLALGIPMGLQFSITAIGTIIVQGAVNIYGSVYMAGFSAAGKIQNIIATVFVTFPFISRELIPVLEAEGSDEEEAAALMGAGGWTIFWKITFPHIKWALLYGVVLCTARAMGEFGAVSVLSGHLRGKTNTLPLHVEILFNEFQYVPAFAVSSLLVIMAVIILVVRSLIEYKGKKEA